MSILSSIIGAASSLAGGFMSSNEAKENRQLQKQAMYKGIQIKVKDAEEAGIHPLYALGASTFQPTPIMSGMGEAVGNAGQDISRAVSAAQDGDERASTYTRALQGLQLERGQLENELLRGQIRNLNAPGTPPVSPDGRSSNAIIPGQGDSRAPVSALGLTVRPRASESQAQDLENEYGEVSDFVGGVRLARDADPVLTKALWQAWEDAKRSRFSSPYMRYFFEEPARIYNWGRMRYPSLYKTDRERR